MRYSEEPTKFNYGPYTVEKAASGKWVWTHPDHEWGSLTRQEYESPFACFKVIDTIEGSQQNNTRQAAAQQAVAQARQNASDSIKDYKGPVLPEREYYTQEQHTAGSVLGLNKPTTDIQDMMLKLNSMIIEQKNPTDIYHHISLILSRIIWQQNIR